VTNGAQPLPVIPAAGAGRHAKPDQPVRLLVNQAGSNPLWARSKPTIRPLWIPIGVRTADIRRASAKPPPSTLSRRLGTIVMER